MEKIVKEIHKIEQSFKDSLIVDQDIHHYLRTSIQFCTSHDPIGTVICLTRAQEKFILHMQRIPTLRTFFDQIQNILHIIHMNRNISSTTKCTCQISEEKKTKTALKVVLDSVKPLSWK